MNYLNQLYLEINPLYFKGVADFQHALETFRLARKMLSEILSSCELIDEDCLNPVVQTLGVRNPLSEHPFYVLIEVSGSNAEHDEEKLNAFLESAMGEGIVSDGTVTNEPSRMQVWIHVTLQCHKYIQSKP